MQPRRSFSCPATRIWPMYLETIDAKTCKSFESHSRPIASKTAFGTASIRLIERRAGSARNGLADELPFAPSMRDALSKPETSHVFSKIGDFWNIQWLKSKHRR